MKLAIKEAKQAVGEGQNPFGACIVKNGEVIASAHNTVLKDSDATAHAEINAIRRACRKLNGADLSGCSVYSTSEPCPMCFTACHLAKVSKIVFGSGTNDMERFGFHKIVSSEEMKRLGNSPVELVGDVLSEESLAIFELWSKQEDQLDPKAR